MKKIAIAQLKGGVGKTTTAVMVGDALAAIHGKRVLSLDLDAQANLSWALIGESMFDQTDEAATMTRWVKQARNAGSASIAGTLRECGLRVSGANHLAKHNVAVSNTDLRFAESEFDGPLSNDPARKLAEKLDQSLGLLSEAYDYVVMDCSPALSALTRAGLRLADAIIAPTPANSLCLESLLTFEAKREQFIGDRKAEMHVLITRRNANLFGNQQAGPIIQSIRSRFSVLDPIIPERSDYAKALTPPQRGRHTTLSERYLSRVDDVRLFATSLRQKGLV